MIKKLRKKFILLALAVVAAVIVVIVAGIDIANYLNMKSEADHIILYLDREAPVGGMGETPPPDLPERSEEGAPNLPGDRAERPKDLPNETAFSARYFTVETDESGKILSYDLSRIAFVAADDLPSYVAAAKSEKGFVSNYRYRKVKTEKGYLVTFLDCEKEIDSCRTFILSSVVITSIGLAAIAILIILLSKKALAPVEESYRKQKQFITDAGHELKTPLTVIGANAELLESDVGEDNEWLRSIKGQVQKMSKLTKELVFLSRMDEAEGELVKAPFSLKSALEDCVEGFKEAALVAGKRMELDLDEVQADANEELIRRAANLLLDNAIKYAEGEEIRLSLRKEGRMGVLEEKNDAALPKGEHPELFERFYRPDTSRSKETGGHGIGLSVVKSIAEAHGGVVSCVSDGKRVTFRFAIPTGGR